MSSGKRGGYRPRQQPTMLDANGKPIGGRGYRRPGRQAINLDEFEAMAFTAVETGSPGHVAYGRQIVTQRLHGELGQGIRGPVGFIEAGPDKRDTLMLRMVKDESEHGRLRQFFDDHPLAWLIVGTCPAAK